MIGTNARPSGKLEYPPPRSLFRATRDSTARGGVGGLRAIGAEPRDAAGGLRLFSQGHIPKPFEQQQQSTPKPFRARHITASEAWTSKNDLLTLVNKPFRARYIASSIYQQPSTMDPLSIVASIATFAQVAVTTSQILYEFTRGVRVATNECDKLLAEINMLQEALSHFGPGLSPVEKLPQTYLMTLSEVTKASTVSLEELLSVLERAPRHARHPSRRLAYIGLPKALESTRDNIRHQREKFLLLLSLRDPELNRRVDVTKDKDKHEDPTLTGFLPEGARVGDIHECRPETAGWTSRAVARWTIPAHSGRGRDSNGVGMGTDYRRILFSRCVEGGLVVVGAAGAAMMSCWAQTQNTDVWTLGSAVGASTLDPGSVQAGDVHGYRATEIVLLQTLIPKAVFDSPAALVTSIAVTTLAMTAYHYLHRHEKYQDPLIFGIAGGGALVGRLAGLDGTGVLLRIIPCCVLVSLLLSAAWSPRLAGKPHRQVDDGAMSLKAGALDAM